MRIAVIALVLAASGGCSGDQSDRPLGPSRVARALLIEGCGSEPAVCRLQLGNEQRLTARLEYSNGDSEPVLPSWRSEHPGVATVDAQGLVRAVGLGDATLAAAAATLTARRTIEVVPRTSDRWTGQFVVRTCTTTGDFDRAEWCGSGDSRVGERWKFDLFLGEQGGRLSGSVSLDNAGGGLTITNGMIQADGRIELTAEGELGIGPCCARLELKAQVRGETLEGRVVLTETLASRAGSVMREGDLEGVVKQ